MQTVFTLTMFKRYDIMFKQIGEARTLNNTPKERTEYIGIRVTPEEKELLKNLAAAAGVSLTGFLLGSAIGEQLGGKYLKRKKRKDT